MLKSRIQYILTWVTLGLLLISGLGLMVISWNGAISRSPSPVLMILLWATMSASGIFLFMLAVKKAHRLWIDDERRKKEAEELERKSSAKPKSSSKENQALDVASTARKLVRRFPEEVPLAKSGQELLKALASELEIMSGILYIRDRSEFKAVAIYAFDFSFRAILIQGGRRTHRTGGCQPADHGPDPPSGRAQDGLLRIGENGTLLPGYCTICSPKQGHCSPGVLGLQV